MTARAGDMRGTHDNSLLQITSGSTDIPEDEAVKAARFVESQAHNDDDCRELLEALGLAPTTTPTGGTR